MPLTILSHHHSGSYREACFQMPVIYFQAELQHIGKYTWLFGLHFYRENRFCHWLYQCHHLIL